MTRRRWLIVQVALLGTVGALAFPGEGSAALGTAFISLTPTGPSPATITVPIGAEYVAFTNTDTVTHTITFANGWCSAELAPNATFRCGAAPHVGNYAYTVDGTVQASVDVTPHWRAVTLKAKHHGFRRGSAVLLQGSVFADTYPSPPPYYGPRMPVTVFERPQGHHLWYRLAVVTAKPLTSRHFPAPSIWRLWVRPHGGTTYMVEANTQPKAGKFWKTAWSKPFGVYARR
jgi:hypothetical protein